MPLIDDVGLWWCPADDQRKLPGRLQQTLGAFSLLTVYGDLPQASAGAPVLHGWLDGNPTTLLRLRYAGHTSQHGWGVSETRLLVDTIIVGRHVAEDVSMQELRVRFSGIENWMNN